MHEKVLLAILVEVHQPGVSLVIGQGDRHLSRSPRQEVRAGLAEKHVQLFRALPHQQVGASVAIDVPQEDSREEDVAQALASQAPTMSR